MARQRLTTTPSGGQSEVLRALLHFGAIRSGITLQDLSTDISHRYGGDNDREGADVQFYTDTVAIVATLAGLGYVVGNNGFGVAVNLAAAPPNTTRVVLTQAGRAQARHPRPRPRYLRG